MVLVHGFLARTIEFDMQWNAFGEDVRLVRYDHRNHGRSERGTRVLHIDELADDLAEVLEQLAPRGHIVLVGHSMGGMTVLSLAARHEGLMSRVKGVALIATGAGHYIEGHRWENGFRWASRRRLLATGLLALRLAAPVLEAVRPRGTAPMRRATRGLVFGTDDVDPATLSMTQHLLEEPPLATLTSLGGSLLRNDVQDGLDRIRQLPVLVLTGAEDKLTRPEHSLRMAEELGANAELVVVPGAGHVVNQTRPVEVNAALRRLLHNSCDIG
jgi:pimeloyl-ACP methyl ester carboxylesterase